MEAGDEPVPCLGLLRGLVSLGANEKVVIDLALDIAAQHGFSLTHAFPIVARRCGLDPSLAPKPLDLLSGEELGTLFRLVGRVSRLAGIYQVAPRTIRRRLDRASVQHPLPPEAQNRRHAGKTGRRSLEGER